MAKFSRGIEGMAYEDTYCENCVNWRFDDVTRTWGCPVWDAHRLFNGTESAEAQSVLDLLIPQRADGHPDKCAMFREAKRRSLSTPDTWASKLPIT